MNDSTMNDSTRVTMTVSTYTSGYRTQFTATVRQILGQWHIAYDLEPEPRDEADNTRLRRLHRLSRRTYDTLEDVAKAIDRLGIVAERVRL